MPKILDHDEERKRIAKASIPLFYELGYAGVSFRELARYLGISKSGLYHYFENKEALFKYLGTLIIPQVSMDNKDVQPDDLVAAFLHICKDLTNNFAKEMTLLLEYSKLFPDQKGLNELFDSIYKPFEPLLTKQQLFLISRLIMGELLLKSLGVGEGDWNNFTEALRFILTSNT
jgi:AcrR family transcriptional regulator